MAKEKAGASHFGAMKRLGLRELREATLPFPERIAHDEIGLYGTALPQEVMQERHREEDREPER